MQRTNNIFGSQHILKIYNYQEDLLQEDHAYPIKSYLEKCFSYIKECCYNYYNHNNYNTFLSSQGYYFIKGKLEVINKNKSRTWEDTLIEAGAILMREGELISISKSLFDTSEKGALLYYGKLPAEKETPYINYVKTFNLEVLTFKQIPNIDIDKDAPVEIFVKLIRNCEKLIHITPELKQELKQFLLKIKPKARIFFKEKDSRHELDEDKPMDFRLLNVLIIYRLIFERRKLVSKITNYYAYFIRPVNLHLSYSGVLHLSLSKYLSDEHYADIAFMLTSVLSNAAIEVIKMDEWKKEIADEQSHSFKHSFGSIITHLSSLKDFNSIRSNNEISIIINKAQEELSSLNKVNDLLLFLSRAGEYGENIDNVDKGSEIKTLKIVSVKQTLLKALKTIEYSLDSLGLSEDNHKENIEEKCLPILIQQLSNNHANSNNDSIINDFQINIMPTGLEVVFLELLKNAIYHTNPITPKVSISVVDVLKQHKEIHFINNTPTSPKLVALIKGTNKNKIMGIAKRYKAGLRTIQRILKFPYFNGVLKENWTLDIVEPATDNNTKTDIFLKIPYSNYKNI